MRVPSPCARCAGAPAAEQTVDEVIEPQLFALTLDPAVAYLEGAQVDGLPTKMAPPFLLYVANDPTDAYASEIKSKGLVPQAGAANAQAGGGDCGRRQ